MSTSYHHDLRAQLTAGFSQLTQGLQDACEVDRVILSLKDTFYDSVRDIIRAWSTRSSISRLPAEVLAMIMGFLPLRSRIAATHVSHAWRVAALAVPAVWEDVTISTRDLRHPEGILATVLSRARKHPVDFVVDGYTTDMGLFMSVFEVLSEHMDHLRSIVWSCAIPSQMFIDEAPMLEHFQTQGDGLDSDFLDGCVGRLRTLHMLDMILPDTCPAVQTVTDLKFSLCKPDGSEMRAPARLAQLLILFPQLRALSLSSILDSHAAVLLELRLPRPLFKLSLRASDRLCDVFAVYEAWQTPSMKDVHLSTWLNSVSQQRFASYVSGARNMTVKTDGYNSTQLDSAAIDALTFDGRKRSLSLVIRLDREDGVERIAQYIASAESSFAQLHALTIQTPIFAELSIRGVALPALQELTLIYDKMIPSGSSYTLSPDELRRCVSQLWRHPVRSLVVEMRKRAGADPASRDQVYILLSELSLISPLYKGVAARSSRCVARLRVSGVPRTAVDEVVAKMLEDQGIDFDYEVPPWLPRRSSCSRI